LDAKARRLEALHASAIIASQTESATPPQPPPPTGPVTESGDSGVNAPQVAPISAAVAPLVQNAAAVKHYPWNSASGQLYQLMEGTVIESVLRNQLDGEFTGPVSVMLTNNVYSLNHQQLLLPQGTQVLGEATRVGSTDQARLAVAFHRLIMPDGYSVSLDKDPALDVIGATGLHDKVNRHYLKIFGVSLAVGAIGGLAQINNNASTSVVSPSVGIRQGITSQTAQEAMQILDRFLNTFPTITIRAGTRVRIWLTGDLELPAYGNHTVSPTL
jgi:type IV secretion system protein VirB10